MAENFDLDKFPTSRAARQMLSRVSPIYDKSYVGKWLFEVMGLEMDEARALVESLRDQCFLERCTWGMRYWEERYGIPVDETKDLEERRAAVLTKRGRKGQPISPAALEDILEALTGREITVTEHNETYSFVISVGEGTQETDYDEIIKKTDTVKPSHLAYSFELARKGTLTVYIGVASNQDKEVSVTEYDQTSVSDIVALADEDGNILCDEDGNIFIDEE